MIVGDRPSGPESSLRSSTLAVLAVRAVAAGLHLAFALPLVALRGPADAGRTLAMVSAIELASLIAHLGLPIDLARRRRLGGPLSSLPTGPPFLAATTAAILAAAIALAGGLPPAPLICGAVAITVNQVVSGWQRGASRFLLASLAHPAPALLAAATGVMVGAGHPVWWYVAGAVGAAAWQLWRVASDLMWTPIDRSALRHLTGTTGLGLAGLANQALLLALPVVLVAQGFESAATVLSLALGAYRPVQIIQAAVNFTVGPIVAASNGDRLSASQRHLLDRSAGVQQITFVPYAIVAGVAVAVVASGVGVGHALPTLLSSWLVLLAGYALAIGTGPTGQVLLMRGNEGTTVIAGICGLIAAVAFYTLPLEPWLRAAGAVSTSLVVQNVVTARGVWHREGWAARPTTVWPAGIHSLSRRSPSASTPTSTSTSTPASGSGSTRRFGR